MSKPSNVILGIRSHAVSVDTATGRELWRTKLKGSQFVTIHHHDDRVFAGAAGELFCLDANGGSILWHNRLKGLGFGIVGFAADRAKNARDLIIGIKGTVVSIDRWSGNENWRSDPLGNGGQSVTLMTLGAKEIVAGHFGQLYCLNRVSGALLWKNKLEGLGYGFVTLGGDDAAIAHAVARARAAAANAG